jgi:Leucine-rich repeat (LRR) protein
MKEKLMVVIQKSQAQEWLNSQSEYNTPEKRAKIEDLDISNKDLKGSLNLEGFTNLKKLNCSDNLLTDLDLTSCDAEKLVELSIGNNNFIKKNLSCFSHFINLEKLYLGTTKQERTKKGIYNRFFGSLEPLKNLTKLKELAISSTDINSGLESLPKSLEKIYCKNYRRNKANCETLRKELKKHLNYYDFQA